jgi:hypothetical protein
MLYHIILFISQDHLTRKRGGRWKRQRRKRREERDKQIETDKREIEREALLHSGGMEKERRRDGKGEREERERER